MFSLKGIRWMHLFFGALLVPAILCAQDTKFLSLETAIDIALKKNPGVLASQKEVDAARGRSWSAWWLPDPTFRLELEEIPTGQGLGSFGERRMAFSQSIDFPVNILFKKKLASSAINISRMELRSTELDVRVEVKRTYFIFLAKRDQLSLAGENLQLAREFNEKAQIRYDVGEAPRLELVRAKVAAAQAENRLTQAQSELVQARSALNALLARPPETPVNAVDSLGFRPLDQTLTELKRQAFENHPRLRRADHQVRVAQQTRNLAWGSFLPSIEASAFRQTIGRNSDLYGIEVGFSIPLWFPFRQRGNIQEATSRLNASTWRRQDEQYQLDATIESTYAAAQSNLEQLENYRGTLLAQADEVYRIALRSYEEGEVSYLQLLEAQQTLIQVRRGYIDALASYQSALAELERATGVELKP